MKRIYSDCRFRLLPLLLAVLGIAAGCQSVKLPVVMNDNPSLTELAQAVNTNSAKIQSLRSDNATLGMSNASGWANGKVAFLRPRNVRLMATAALVGKVVDFGSNDERFWFWSQYQNPAQVYWAKNSEYATSPMKEAIPVDPVWFPEALGVIEINPSEVVEGPVVQKDKTLMVTTTRQLGKETFQKKTYIEPKTAAVKRQDVIAPNGEVVITVICNEFQVDEATQAVLPKKLEIRCPKSEAALQIDLGKLQVNSGADDMKLYQMPTNEELGVTTAVDIGSGTVPTIAAPAGSTAAPAAQNPADSAAAPAVNPPMVAPPAGSASNASDASAASNPPMVAPPAGSTANTAGTTGSAAPANTANANSAVPSTGAGSGAEGFTYQPNSTEIPSSGPAVSSTAVTADFRTNAVPSGDQYLNNSQSYFVPPAD